MLFGQKPRRGLFGDPGGRYGITPGTIEERPTAPPMPNAPDMGVPGLGMQAPAAAPKHKTNWGGIAADFLAGVAGQPGPYLAQLQAQRERAARQQEQALARTTAYEDWVRKQEYEQAHPKPANNDTLNDMAAAASWTPEQWAIYDKLHPVYRVGPDGIPYPMARGGNAVPPTAPVGKLTPIGGGPQVPPAGNFR